MNELKKFPKTHKELFRMLEPELKKLLFKQWGAKQNPKYHPEGNTLKHIFIVVKRAFIKYPNEPNMIMAALFHDLGKMDTYKINDKTGRPTAYGHEKVSEEYVEQFRPFIESFENTNVDAIKYIVKNHMKMKPNVWDVMKQKKKDKLEKMTDLETGEIIDNPNFKSLKDFEQYLDGGGTNLMKEMIRKRLRNLLRESLLIESIKKEYIGQCDILRRNCTGEDNWQEMMEKKEEIPFNTFFNNVDMSNLLDDGETSENFHQDNLRSDPDTKTFKSTWGNKETLFYQTAGFEFIFV